MLQFERKACVEALRFLIVLVNSLQKILSRYFTSLKTNFKAVLSDFLGSSHVVALFGFILSADANLIQLFYIPAKCTKSPPSILFVYALPLSLLKSDLLAAPKSFRLKTLLIFIFPAVRNEQDLHIFVESVVFYRLSTKECSYI